MRLFLAAAVFLFAPALPGQPSSARDYELKAAFLVKFTQYTTWPSSTFTASNTPVVIGVLDADPLFDELQKQAKDFVSARPIEIRHVNSLDEAASCHVLFLGEAMSRKEADWFTALRGKPILTVGESDRTIEHGAIMRFVIKNRSVRFEANLAASAANQLELSERMLTVAAKVYKTTRATSP